MSNISSAHASYTHVSSFGGASRPTIDTAQKANGSIPVSPLVAAFVTDLELLDGAARKADSTLQQFLAQCQVIPYVPAPQSSPADASRAEALRHASVAGYPAGAAALSAGN